MNTWRQSLRRSLAQRGLLGTCEQALYAAEAHLPPRLQNAWDTYVERRFDQQWGVDTAGVTEIEELESHPRYLDAERYQATPPQSLRRMLRPLRIDHRSFVFVDVGCGKGKAVLIATGYPFKKVIGVELSPSLADIAKCNLRTYRGPRTCTNVEIQCADAADYELPAEPLIVFLFNPFGETTMRAFLEQVRRSLSQYPRELYVLYNIAKQRALLDSCGFMTPVRHMNWFSIYRSVLPPSLVER